MTEISTVGQVGSVLGRDRGPNTVSSDPTSDTNHAAIDPVYFNPTVRLDPVLQIAIWETRDPKTGEITEQYPTAKMVEAYRNLVLSGVRADGVSNVTHRPVNQLKKPEFQTA